MGMAMPEAVPVDKDDRRQLWSIGGIPVHGKAALAEDRSALWVAGARQALRVNLERPDQLEVVEFESLGVEVLAGDGGPKRRAPWVHGCIPDEQGLLLVVPHGAAVLGGDRTVLHQWLFDRPVVAADCDQATTLVTLDDDGLAVRTLPDGRLRERFEVSFAVGAVDAMALSADRSEVVVGGWVGGDGWFEVWSLDERRVVSSHRTDSRVRAAAWTDDGAVVLGTAGDPGVVMLWNRDGSDGLETIGDQPSAVTAITVVPRSAANDAGASSRVATGGADGVIRVWTPDRGEVASLWGHADSAWWVGFADGRIVSCGADGTARCWNPVEEQAGTVAPANGGRFAPAGQHRQAITTIDVSHDASRVLTISTDRARVLDFDGAGTWSVAASWDWRRLLSGALNPSGHSATLGGVGWVGDWRFDADATEFNESYRGPVRSVVPAPGRGFAFSAGNGGPMVWNPAGAYTGDEPPVHSGTLRTVAGSPDGAWAAAADSSGIGLWRLDAGGSVQLERRLVAPSTVRSVALADQARVVVGVDDTGTVRTWNGRTGQPIGERRVHDGSLGCAIAADGAVVALWGHRTVSAWDADLVRQILSWRSDVPVTAIAVAGDAVLVACLNRLRALPMSHGRI